MRSKRRTAACTITQQHTTESALLLTPLHSPAILCHCLQCVVKCCEKFMNVTGRVGMRFSEFFTQMEAAAQQHMQEALKQQEAMAGK